MSITGNITRSGITRNVTRGVTESFFSGLTPQLHYEFAASKSLAATIGPSLVITRAGTVAKYRDSSGVVQTASANTGRFDHDASGTSLGLLVEEARTNIALHSNDWTSAVYDTVTNITAVKDATGPDGNANSASTLTADANNGVISQSITVASAAYTTSVWMKRKTGTGTVEITDNGFTNATDITADINSSTWTQVGNITRTQANPVIGIRLGTSGDEVEVAYLQCEAGGFATSPIETTTATVARPADLTNPNTTVDWFGSAGEGSVYFHGTILSGSIGAGEKAAYFFDGASDVYSRLNNSSGGHVSIINAGVLSGSAPAANEMRMTIGYATDDAIQYLDGSANGADTTSVAPPTSLTRFYIGKNAGGSYWNGHIAEIRYYNTRLTNAQLLAMSNGTFP